MKAFYVNKMVRVSITLLLAISKNCSVETSGISATSDVEDYVAKLTRFFNISRKYLESPSLALDTSTFISESNIYSASFRPIFFKPIIKN
jgi:hypothetical protein